jgi:hypothetical protein
MGRKILFITTDQQRYDTVGANGGLLSRTPVRPQGPSGRTGGPWRGTRARLSER